MLKNLIDIFLVCLVVSNSIQALFQPNHVQIESMTSNVANTVEKSISYNTNSLANKLRSTTQMSVELSTYVNKKKKKRKKEGVEITIHSAKFVVQSDDTTNMPNVDSMKNKIEPDDLYLAVGLTAGIPMGITIVALVVITVYFVTRKLSRLDKERDALSKSKISNW